jgi:hypothetical protein
MFHSSCRMAGSSGGNRQGFTSLWIVRERPAIGNQTNNGGRPNLPPGLARLALCGEIFTGVFTSKAAMRCATQNIATEPIA